jgi:hypothetical protein
MEKTVSPHIALRKKVNTFSIAIGCVLFFHSLNLSRADILYVSERDANIIRRYDLNTGADLGVFASTGLAGPAGLAFDSFGNLFVANSLNGTISKITAAGVVSTFASASFAYGLAIDGVNNVYASTPVSGLITKFTPSGVGSTFHNGGGTGQPIGLAFDSGGNLYGGGNSGSILKYAANGTIASHISGAGGFGLAFDANGNLFSSNPSNDTIGKISPEGAISTFATGLNDPYGLAFDSAGNLFVGEIGSSIIRKFTPEGNSSVFANSGPVPLFLAVQIVPEPACAAFLGLALTSLLFLHRRKI